MLIIFEMPWGFSSIRGCMISINITFFCTLIPVFKGQSLENSSSLAGE
jgi:hypothetical protein